MASLDHDPLAILRADIATSISKIASENPLLVSFTRAFPANGVSDDAIKQLSDEMHNRFKGMHRIVSITIVRDTEKEGFVTARVFRPL